MGTIFVIVLLDLIGFGIVIPQLGIYGCQFQASPLVIGLLMSIYSLMQLVFAPILGRLSDRFGRRPVLLISLAGSVLGYLLFAFAPSLSWLFASRIIDGISGGNISTAQAYISDVTTPENRARGMGMIGASFGLGFILGPAVGGVLGHYGGGMAIGLASAGLSALAFVLTLIALPEPKRHERTAERSVAFIGRALRLPIVNLCVLLQLFFTAAFSMMEGTFALFLVVRHLHHASTSAFELAACDVASADRDFVQRASALAGWIFMAIGIASTILQGGLIGPLKRRFGERRLVVAGCIVTAVGLAFVPVMPTYALLFIPAVLLAIGGGLFNPSLSATVSLSAPKDEQGEVLGSYQAAGALGRIIGPAAGGALFAALSSAAPYAFGAVIMMFCVGLALLLSRRLRPRAAATDV